MKTRPALRERIGWYWNRARCMTTAEFAHRSATWLRNTLERIAHTRRPVAYNITAEATTPSWLPPGTPADSNAWTVAAERIHQGHNRIFGLDLPHYWQQVDWNTDPLTGIRAPLTYGKSINLTNRDLTGDIKYLWEQNRHLHLAILARAYAMTGAMHHAVEALRQIDEWIRQCPYPMGVNWASGLECAIRLINWALVWQYLDCGHPDIFTKAGFPDLRSRWLNSIWQHCHFIDSNWSTYSSANNHLLGEAAGLSVGAATWPLWNDSPKWCATARRILLTEITAQIHADGVSKEQSVGYQCFVIEFLMLAGISSERTGNPMPESYWKTIEKMAEFVTVLSVSTGTPPMIGDADDGHVVHMAPPIGKATPQCALDVAAALFSRPTLLASNSSNPRARHWLVGERQGLFALCDTSGSQRPLPDQFPQGGYYILDILRNDGVLTRLIADAGPLGYLSIAAHGHADALAITLSSHGKDFLIDPGTYLYHGEPAWREYFRGTSAHNTIRLDGHDQSRPGGRFMWTQHASSRCVLHERHPHGERLVIEHDGYLRLKDPVRHRRIITSTYADKKFILEDEIFCASEHTVERWWHFHESCNVNIRSGTLDVENDGVLARILLDESALTDLRTHHGNEKPIAGWISRSYGAKIPTTSVCETARIHGTTQMRAEIILP